LVFLDKEQLNLYIVPGEPVPERSVRQKSHIFKVMFLVVMARPCYNDTGECTFDGKISTWPLVERVAARRAAVCRPAGTIKTKPVNVMAQKYREFMIEMVSPAIKLKWPDWYREIVIQQDGASSHINQDDPGFTEAARDTTAKPAHPISRCKHTCSFFFQCFPISSVKSWFCH
jgi:hypothetical protein